MKIISKVTTLIIMSAMVLITSLQAKESKQIPVGISKPFATACEKKSIEDPYTDYRVFIRDAKPVCRVYAKSAQPHCPKGYGLLQGKCKKVNLIQ